MATGAKTNSLTRKIYRLIALRQAAMDPVETLLAPPMLLPQEGRPLFPMPIPATGCGLEALAMNL